MLLLLHRGGRAWVTVTHTQYDGKIYTTLGFCPVFLSLSLFFSSHLEVGLSKRNTDTSAAAQGWFVCAAAAASPPRAPPTQL